jgi:hypothetical protein
MSCATIAKSVAAAVALALAVTSTFAQKAATKPREPAKDVAGAKDARLAKGGFNADAPAQRYGETVARLRKVEGNVLVSQESGLASAEEAQRLDERSRVITTASAKAIVTYDDGCEVELGPNQRLEIRSDQACAERVAQAETIFKEPAGMALAAAGTGVVGGATAAALAGVAGAGVLGTAGVSGLAALLISRQETAVSPN